MTIAEADRFYEQDSKSYEIEKNKEFLGWLKDSVYNGYHCYMGTDDLQRLVNNIVNWYEIKYPERELEYYEGTIYTEFYDVKRLSNVMDIRQLLYRLPERQLSLIECGYRAKGGGQHPIYEDGKVNGWESFIAMKINRKNIEEDNYYLKDLPYFLLFANDKTGQVENDHDVEKYTGKKENINLEGLLSLLNEKYTDELDFTELKECIYDHECDKELRNRILQLVALKLLYSRNTIPERGYERAKRFINEFNKKMGLSLSTVEIDDAINRDYSKEEKWKKVLKTYVGEDGKEHSYWTVVKEGEKPVENVVQEEKKPVEDSKQELEETKGIQKIFRRIFNK